jgi:cobalt-zinc-cadmium efflux system outer membrane protein
MATHGITATTFLIILTTIAVASAQERLTLEETIHRAIEANPDLRRERYDVDAADADIITAGLRPNPQLNLNADLFSASAPIVTPERKQYGLSVSMPFELGDKRDARMANAETRKHLVESGLHESERSVALSVSDGWHAVAQAARTLAIIRSARATFDSLVAVNRIRLRDQVITPTELTRSTIAADQYAVEEHQAEFDLAKARQQLGMLIGVMEPVDVDDRIDTSAITLPVDSLVAHAVEHRADIVADTSAIDAARANEQLQHAIAVPDISLSLDYNRQVGTPFYGFSASVPLQIFSRNQGEIRKGVVLREQAESTLAAARRRAAAEVRLAYDEYENRHRSLEGLASVLASAESVRSTVEYAYRSGNTTILDFLEAQRTWFETRRAWDDALIDFSRSRAALAILAGMTPGGR